MVEVVLMPEVQVGPMQDVAEELVLKLVAKFVVGATTGTRKWVLSALAAIMHQQLTSMLAAVQDSTASKKLVSPGLAIAVASSSYPSPSSCYSRCFPCCTTCSSLVPSHRHIRQRRPHPSPRQRHSRLIAQWGLRSSGRVARRCIAVSKWAMKAGCQQDVKSQLPLAAVMGR